jgi:hypothetical protein
MAKVILRGVNATEHGEEGEEHTSLSLSAETSVHLNSAAPPRVPPRIGSYMIPLFRWCLTDESQFLSDSPEPGCDYRCTYYPESIFYLQELPSVDSESTKVLKRFKVCLCLCLLGGCWAEADASSGGVRNKVVTDSHVDHFCSDATRTNE